MLAVPQIPSDGQYPIANPARSVRVGQVGVERHSGRASLWTPLTMYRGHSVGVVIPAYNEGAFIGDVIDGVPEFVDRVYVVDDCSTDDTWKTIQDRTHTEPRPLVPTDGGVSPPDRLVPIRHETNQGRGAAVTTGYEAALEDDVDVVAVMDGDGQMDPEILDNFLDPIVEGVADYTKGDRLRLPEHRAQMSNWRQFGNLLLTGLTRVASGYWGMTDPQNGYTAISREMLAELDLDGLYDRYGFLNDVLVQLNEHGARIVDVPMSARYGDEESGIQYTTFVPSLSFLLAHRFVRRLWVTYGALSRHPVGLLYGLGALVMLGTVGRTALMLLAGSGVARAAVEAAVPGFVAAFLLVTLAMATDRQVNRRLVSVFRVDGSIEKG